MVSLTTDDALRRTLIERGTHRAAEFSDAKRMAREYLALFEDALQSAGLVDQLAGNYEDGWAGPQLIIQVAPATGSQTLDLEFCAPAWLPKRRVTIQASRDGRDVGDPIVVQRGDNAELSLPMDATGGRYEVTIAPTFVPARSGHGDDWRELSVMLRRCVVARGSESVELFRADKPA
jgi:hypothetical protein